MRKTFRTCALAVALSLAFPAVYATELRVFAAASLSDVMKELSPAYEAQTGDKLVFNLAGSNVLARQMQEGAPADVFLSADEKQMDLVANAGLIVKETRSNLLSNTLVIIVPKDAPRASLAPDSLGSKTVKRIALADPRSVPAGVYAKEYLAKLQLWKDVEPKVVPMENVRAALAAVESGNADAGIVYQTDAAISKGVKVAFAVPSAEGPKISYPVAVLAKSKNLNGAKAFIAWLASDAGWKYFKKYGFLGPVK